MIIWKVVGDESNIGLSVVKKINKDLFRFDKISFILPFKVWTVMNEEIILMELKNGSEVAFRQFFNEYYDSLILFANHIMNDSVAAEDIVQECFVDFWVNKRYKNMSSGLDRYIFQAVKHSSLNYIRGGLRRARRDSIAMQKMQEDNSMPEEQSEQMILLYAAINRLPEERKKIFMMICLEGRKYQEVADLMRISINTVKTQMGRAFHFLRNELLGDKFTMILLKIIFMKRES